MKGLNKEIREALRQSCFEKIIKYIMDICKVVVTDSERNKRKLPNNENRIRSIVLEEYLDNNKIRSIYNMSGFRFMAENMENYDGNGDYIGRTDIRIILNTDFQERNAYYLVECKRIDGSKNLNEKYVEEGVARFVKRKYSSYYGKNIMLGFVVKKLDILKNANLIEDIQNSSKDGCLHGCFKCIADEDKNEHFRCIYQIDSGELELRHIFTDFSSVM